MLFIVKSSTKYFVVGQQCNGKLLLKFYCNTVDFNIVSSYSYVIYQKNNVSLPLHGKNVYAKVPRPNF